MKLSWTADVRRFFGAGVGANARRSSRSHGLVLARFPALTLVLVACLWGNASHAAAAADVAAPAPASAKPGAKGAKTAKPPKPGGIRFSSARGFYEAPFELTLTAPAGAGAIRYTLDGSPPGPRSGTAYTQPIPIRGTTVVRAAVLSADGKVSRPETHTYLFTSDIVRQSADRLPPADWPYAWGGNVVDYGMDPAVVDDPKYREAIQPALKSLPTYSLVTDLANLFDDRKGIYANSDQSGREWERPASVELIWPDGRKGFQSECGVRIRGGFSSGGFNPKHAFRLYFRKEYGDGKLVYPVFGNDGVKEFDSFDLRCSQNYSWNIGADPRAIFVRDEVNRDLQRAMGQPAARAGYCHLYLNGQYWGLYGPCERPEASFGASTLGGHKENYDVIKTGGVGGGMNVGATDGTMDAWNRLVTAAKVDLADNANYFRLLGRRADGSPDPNGEVLLDPANLVDYLLVIWYGGNLDAPVSRFGGNRMPNNWHALRNRTTRDGFKFFVWDAEHTFLDVEEDRTGPYPGGDRPEASHPQWLFQRCAENAEFRVLLADRIHRYFRPGGLLTPESVRPRLEARLREIEAAVICESARWGDVDAGGPFGPPGESRETRPGPDGRPHPVPRTRDGEWRTEAKRLLDDYVPQRSDIVRFQLWRQGFVSDLEPPASKPDPDTKGGKTSVTLTAPRGEIWYSVDGQDPRRVGGEPAASAKRYDSPIAVEKSAKVLARVRLGAEWSPLVSVDGGSEAR